MSDNGLDLATATSEQLRAFRSNIRGQEGVTQEMIDDLDMLIIDRTVTEKMDSGITQFQQTQAKDKNKSRAEKRWPELRDPESDFYKEVMKRVEDRGDSATALLDAANEYGLEQGLLPEGIQPGKGGTSMESIGAGGGGAEDDRGETFLENTKDIAAKFEAAGLLDMSDEKTRKNIMKHAEGDE